MESTTAVSVIEFAPEHKPAFKALNLAWLDAYNLTESHDLLVLDDPQRTILDRGGKIFVATTGEQVVGSAALMKEKEGVYELAKMAVAKEYQGKGISHLLISRCLQEAKHLGAKKLLLFSNHQLTTAIRLYENYGFRQVPVKDSPFATADVRMELTF